MSRSRGSLWYFAYHSVQCVQVMQPKKSNHCNSASACTSLLSASLVTVYFKILFFGHFSWDWLMATWTLCFPEPKGMYGAGRMKEASSSTTTQFTTLQVSTSKISTLISDTSLFTLHQQGASGNFNNCPLHSWSRRMTNVTQSYWASFLHVGFWFRRCFITWDEICDIKSVTSKLHSGAPACLVAWRLLCGVAVLGGSNFVRPRKTPFHIGGNNAFKKKSPWKRPSESSLKSIWFHPNPPEHGQVPEPSMPRCLKRLCDFQAQGCWEPSWCCNLWLHRFGVAEW